MKATKKILSLLLAVVMLLTVVSMAPLSANADVTYTKVVPGNAANTILMGQTRYSGDNVAGNYSAAAANVSEMQAASGVEYKYTNGIIFLINAPAAGDYSVYVNYGVGSEHLADGKTYKMVAAVNELDFYTGSKTISKTTAWQDVTEDYFTLNLKAGTNIVRFLPISNNDWTTSTSVWVDFKALYIDSTLSTVDVSAAANKTTLYPGQSSYINYYTASGNNLGGLNSSALNQAGITFDNLKTVAQFSAIPYYSYTVNVPADGYYYMEQTASVPATDAVSGYVVVRVDDTNYKRGFIKKDTSAGAFKIDLGVYMTAGTHVVTVTAPLAYEGEITQTMNGNYPTWFDFRELVIYGNGTVSTDVEQQNPLVITANAGVIEAEGTDAVQYGYGQTNEATDFSGGAALSYASWDYNKAQTKESLKTWFDKSNMLAVSYGINVTESGNYTFTPIYEVGVADSSSTLGNYRMNILVDDKTLIEVPYVKDATKSKSINMNTFDINLDAGYHVIRMIPLTYENRSAYWTNIDGLGIPEGVAKVSLGDTTRFEAEEAEFVSNFNTRNLATEEKEGYLAGMNYISMQRLGVTMKDINMSVFSDVVPYVSFTVNVPYAGYYDMTAYFTSAYNANTETPYYIVSSVNGEYFANGFSEVTSNSGNFEENRANVSAYLKEGENIIAIGAVIPLEDATNFKYDWIDYDALTIAGGASLSATQKSPGYARTTIKAQDFTYTNRFTFNVSTDPNTFTYSFVGNASNWAYPDIDNLSKYIEPGATPYVALALYAPEAGKYSFTTRFKLGNANIEHGELTDYINEVGYPYHIAVCNGKTYKFDYMPTKQGATTEYPNGFYPMGWWVTSPLNYIELDAGLNIVYFTSTDRELSKHITQPWIDIAYITVPETLTLMNDTVLYYMGDVNGDIAINVRDILRTKLYLAGSTSEIDLLAANVSTDSSAVNSNDLAAITKAVIDPVNNPELLQAKIREKTETDVTAFVSTPAKEFFMREDSSVKVTTSNPGGGTAITVNPNSTSGNFEGFGASMTDSSAENMILLKKYNREQYDSIMKDLYSKTSGDALGLEWDRQPIGASDFADVLYTYCDLPQGQTDTSLSKFSLAEDEKHIIPILQDAETYNPNLKIFGTPWTAPLWMKEEYDWNTIDLNGNGNSNGLQTQYYQTYANYIKKFIEGYEGHGLDVAIITPQNEYTGQHGITSMYFTTTEMKNFVRNNLYPTVGGMVEIFGFDFNWWQPSNTTVMTTFSGMTDYYSGCAFHPYGGNVESQKNFRDSYPGERIFLTEGAGNIGGDNFVCNTGRTISAIRYGAQAFFYWNICLDEQRGPIAVLDTGEPGNPIGTGLLTFNSVANEIVKNEDYYCLAHFAKFIRKGAVLVSSTETNTFDNYYKLKGLANLVMRNTDGSYVCAITNYDPLPKKVNINTGLGYYVTYVVPGRSCATITWTASSLASSV